MFGFLRRKPDAIEARSTVLADGSVTISDRTGMMQILGLVEMAAGEAVTIDTALGVPAVFAAVNFLSRSLASLPLTVFERTGTEVARAEGDLERILNEAWNEQSSSFDARKYGFDQVFTGGRMFVFIERNQLGKLKALWPLNPEQITIIREGGKKRYDYRDGARTVHYAATDIIDVPFMLKAAGPFFVAAAYHRSRYRETSSPVVPCSARPMTWKMPCARLPARSARRWCCRRN